MKISPPVVMTAVIATLLVVGVWLAPEQTTEPTKSVSLPASTYDALRQSGEVLKDETGKPMSVAKVIEALIAGKETTAAAESLEVPD